MPLLLDAATPPPLYVVMAISICFDTVGTYKANKVAKIEEKERNFNLCRQFSSFKTPFRKKNVFLVASIFRVTLGRYPMFYDAQLAFLDEHQECQNSGTIQTLSLLQKFRKHYFFVNAQMFRFKD